MDTYGFDSYGYYLMEITGTGCDQDVGVCLNHAKTPGNCRSSGKGTEGNYIWQLSERLAFTFEVRWQTHKYGCYSAHTIYIYIYILY